MYIPANAGPIAIPMNKRSAPIPVDIPTYCFGAEDTMIFHTEVLASDKPAAIMARFVDTSSSDE
jgi:hypothetical protein